MPRFEYKVVPAPAKGLKGKGIKGSEARFSHALQELMNGLAAEGWEYQRAETLPSLERVGLTGSTTEWRNVLVFRRMRENEAELFAPELLPAPDETPPETVAAPAAKADTPRVEEKVAPLAAKQEETAPKADPKQQNAVPGKDEPFDNGVEDTDSMNRVGASLTNLAAVRDSGKSSN